MSTADKIRAKLPSWFRMRYDKNSAGWQLIDVFGSILDEYESTAEYAALSKYLKTAPDNQPYVCYMGRLPAVCFEPDFKFTLHGQGRVLRVVDDIWTFLVSSVPELSTPHLYTHDIAYVDRADRAVYTMAPYDNKLTVLITNADGRQIASVDITLSKQQLWNTLDELGILLSTPRLPGEDNHSYRLRLYAASRLSHDASKRGLLRGIAKELGLYTEATWHDGGTDFIIPHRYVLPETIMVDYEPVEEGDFIVGDNGQVCLLGREEYAGQQRHVLYAYGVKLQDLSTNDDPEVVALLYKKDGTPSENAVRLKEEIDRAVPVKWGHFIWGDAFWDAGAYSLLENIYDAATHGFWRSVEA
jgi:hypothetical protein